MDGTDLPAESKPMNITDPKLVALQFNGYINRQDVDGLSNLMTDDHTFIDRKGESVRGKAAMTDGWINFSNPIQNTRIPSTGADHEHSAQNYHPNPH